MISPMGMADIMILGFWKVENLKFGKCGSFEWKQRDAVELKADDRTCVI